MAAAAGRGDVDSRLRGNDGLGGRRTGRGHDGRGRRWFEWDHDGPERCGAAGSGRALLARVYGCTTPATLTPDSAALPASVSAALHVRGHELLAEALPVGVSAAPSAAGAGACARPPAFVIPPPRKVEAAAAAGRGARPVARTGGAGAFALARVARPTGAMAAAPPAVIPAKAGIHGGDPSRSGRPRRSDFRPLRTTGHRDSSHRPPRARPCRAGPRCRGRGPGAFGGPAAGCMIAPSPDRDCLSLDPARLDSHGPRPDGGRPATALAGEPAPRRQHRVLRHVPLPGRHGGRPVHRQEPQRGLASGIPRPGARKRKERLPEQTGDAAVSARNSGLCRCVRRLAEGPAAGGLRA